MWEFLLWLGWAVVVWPWSVTPVLGFAANGFELLVLVAPFCRGRYRHAPSTWTPPEPEVERVVVEHRHVHHVIVEHVGGSQPGVVWGSAERAQEKLTRGSSQRSVGPVPRVVPGEVYLPLREKEGR